ncbi:MAG: riboflavin biosynthesis protein RibD, partial [Gammaproteobacteria bacterium]|nr:riboflavin biosynthesis protein RibD [Gammaproteobacteria bacterium]
AQMLQSDLVDEWIIYLSGKILGSLGKSAFYWDKALALSESLALKFKTIELCGEDIKIVAFKDKPKLQA